MGRNPVEQNNSKKNSKSALWRNARISGLIFGIIGVLILTYFILKTIKGIAVPDINQGMSYGLLFIVGLLTGFHCIAMCGGFIIGFTAKGTQENKKTYQAPLLYGAGKLVSYTVIGAVFGWIGALIAFTPLIRGIVGITAGAMAWGLQYLKLQVSNGKRIVIFEQSVWWRWRLESRIHGSESAVIRILQNFGLLCMDGKGCPSVFYHLANGSDVICVCMGNDNQADLEIHLTNVAQDSGCVPCWINNHAIPSLLRRNEVTVCSKGYYLQSSVNHFYHWHLQGFSQAVLGYLILPLCPKLMLPG